MNAPTCCIRGTSRPWLCALPPVGKELLLRLRLAQVVSVAFLALHVMGSVPVSVVAPVCKHMLARGSYIARARAPLGFCLGGFSFNVDAISDALRCSQRVPAAG